MSAHIIQVCFNWKGGGFSLDYYEIGQRVRKYRKAHGFSQEELAERVNISTTHMSHIETGNTKLSLSVLVSLSEALEVDTDKLLFSAKRANKSAYTEEILSLLEGCTPQQLAIIVDILRAVKISLNKYL